VAFSPDSKTLAAGADDGVLYLWDAGTGKLKAELKLEVPAKPPININSIEFLPKGRLAATYHYEARGAGTQDVRIVLWDLRTKKAETLFEDRGAAHFAARSPDGTLLAAGVSGSKFQGVRVWDLKTKKVLWEEGAGSDVMSGVAFSRDGTKLAVGGYVSVELNGGFGTEGRLWLFDVKARKRLWRVEAPGTGALNRLAFSKDGKGVFTGSTGRVVRYQVKGGGRGSKVVSELRRWDTKGKMVWSVEGELGHFHSISLSEDGKTLAGGDSEQLMLFDPEKGTRLGVVTKTSR